MILSGNGILAAKCISSQMAFVKYFFHAGKKRFIENWHHRVICDALDSVMEGKIRRLIINIWPRSGKTDIAVKKFMARGLAVNPSAKFIHISYSDDLACDNSDEVRELVKSEEYQALFPYVRVSPTTDSKKKWYTTEGGGVYAVASGGQITGFGAGAVDDGGGCRFSGAIIIDDPIKPDDALNDSAREKVNMKFETTIRNRVNSVNTPIIVIMQRLHENDLCGYLMKTDPGEWTVLSIPAVQGDGGSAVSTWEARFPLAELRRIEERSPFVFETQYMQNPTPMEGLMYASFRTYREIPVTVRAVRKNYTDSADKGEDFLCSIDYVETETGNYITDVLYTQEPMEVTETSVARMMAADLVEVANIEGNNGGEGFARNVERNLRIMGAASAAVKTFHQSANKEVRIFSRSAEVQNMVFFPEGWEMRWPAFHAALKSYRRAGKNAHDDAPDAVTGTVEMRDEYSFSTYPSGIELEGECLVELHAGSDNTFFGIRAVCFKGEAYATWAYAGEIPGWDELSEACSDAEVHIEVPAEMEWYVREFRERVGRCWARKSGNDSRSVTDSYRGHAMRLLRFPDNGSCAGFINSMLLYDGRDNAGAMYAASCLMKRKFLRKL